MDKISLMENIEIKLSKSKIGSTQRQKDTLKALGLNKVNDCKMHKDTLQIRGMVLKVSHLVNVKKHI